MSSFVAHTLVGGVIGQRVAPTVAGIAVGVVFALLPDIDYALLWLRGEGFAVRWTHSVSFVVLAAGTMLWRRELFLIALLSGLSHLAMDTLVGVHRNPLLWPLMDRGFASPIGLLPSAGRLDPTNFYFWRNLLIEKGILLPLLAAMRAHGGLRIAALLVAGAFMVWSLSLAR